VDVGEGAFDYVISLVVGSLAFAAIDRAGEFEANAIDGVGDESKLVAVEFALLEELVDEGFVVAIWVFIARDEAGDSAVVFNGYLHEFAFLKESVHTGIIFGWGWGGSGLSDEGRRECEDEESDQFHIYIRAWFLETTQERGYCGIPPPSTALRVGSFAKCERVGQPAPQVPIWTRPWTATRGYNESTRER
jgi:hypothetical protein